MQNCRNARTWRVVVHGALLTVLQGVASNHVERRALSFVTKEAPIRKGGSAHTCRLGGARTGSRCNAGGAGEGGTVSHRGNSYPLSQPRHS